MKKSVTYFTIIFLGIFIFLGGYNQAEAVILYGLNHPSQIQRTGKPDFFIDSITKNAGLRRVDNGSELPPSTWINFTPYQTSLGIIDDGARLNCRTADPAGCGLFIYGANDGNSSTDDMKRQSLTSSNSGVVNCPNTSGCNIQGPGTATITLTFVYEWGIVSPVNTWDRNLAEANRLFRFSMSSLTYYINVLAPASPPPVNPTPVNPTPVNPTPVNPPPPPPPPPNQAASVTYTSTTNISYNTATSNWRYSDPEGDPQSNSSVQIATDSGFSNIVLSRNGNSSATNMALSGLRPGTTYYPRVRGYNSVNGWTGWSNGPAFTTIPNNPPNLGEFSCSAVPTGYTTARVNWNYTGSDPDALILRMRYKRPVDTRWTTVNLPGNRTGIRDISNLIPGDGYTVEISVTDIYNNYPPDRWTGCGTVTPTPYPAPVVDFSLTGLGNTVRPGGTLTVNTGDSIGVNWNITNTDGVNLSTCRITTSGPRQIFNINPLRSFSGGASNTPVADSIDQRYTVRLQCSGITPANPVRNIDQSIDVLILSRPIISCTVNNTVVASESPLVGITGSVTNGTAPYTWSVSKDGQAGPYTILSGITGATFNSNIDYTGVGLGKYTPWLRVVDRNNRTASKACDKGITNLGDRTIREIAP